VSVARARLAVVVSSGVLVALAITGCDAPARPSAGAVVSTTPTIGGQPPSGFAPSAACPPTAATSGWDERQGTGDGATLWALLFPTEPQLKAGHEIKIAWRMTGSGELSINATGPDGTVVKPVWGPEAHGGSNWNRPGGEWGTGWVFPSAGCWTIHAERTSGSGALALRVAG